MNFGNRGDQSIHCPGRAAHPVGVSYDLSIFMSRRSVEWQGSIDKRLLNLSDCQFKMNAACAGWKELRSVVQFGNDRHTNKQVRWPLGVQPSGNVRIRPG